MPPGVERTSRIAGVVDGRPQTEDGEVLDVANVIWCTGFEPDFGWVDLPGLDSSGRLDERARCASSVSPASTCWARSSSTCSTRTPSGGVGKDAAYVVEQLDREPAGAPREPAVAS